MDKQSIKKIRAVSFLVTGVVAWVTVSVLFKALAGSFGAVQKLYGNEAFAHGLPILVGVAVFLYLQLSEKTNTLADDVILEVSKVNWPAQKDVTGMTIVVIVMVAIASLLLLGVDTVAREIVKLLVEVPAMFG
jgi:preprotein translocase SecE subunit